MRYILILLMIFTGMNSLQAQDKDEAKESDFFADFVNNHTEYQNTIRFKAEKVFNLTYKRCDSTLAYSKSNQTILIPAVEREIFIPLQEETFEEDTEKETNIEEALPAAPMYGQWIEHIFVKGCEKTLPVNLLVVAYKGEKPIILPLINGKTKLDPIDQPFVENAISNRLKLQDKPCELAPFIINSNLIGYRSPKGNQLIEKDEGYGWFESWEIKACDQKFNANIAILPDPKKRYKYITRLKRTQ